MAAIAQLYELHANVVHRWRVDERNAVASAIDKSPSGFLGVNILPEIQATPGPAPPADIHVKVVRANATIVVKWPLQDSAACAAWPPSQPDEGAGA